MAETHLIEPDLNFIKEVGALGGEDLKKCYQCASCSVACKISPDTRPFPRKEMIAASWGLKDKLVSNSDIWLCHNCGDCSTICPREAKPGDVLAAVRSYAIEEYSRPKALAQAMNDMAAQLDEKIKTVTRQRSEQEAILRGMVEGVLAIDTAEHVVGMNNACGRMLGGIYGKHMLGGIYGKHTTCSAVSMASMWWA